MVNPFLPKCRRCHRNSHVGEHEVKTEFGTVCKMPSDRRRPTKHFRRKRAFRGRVRR